MRTTIGAIVASLLLCTACGSVAARPDATLGDVPSKGPVGRTIKSNGEKFSACGRDSVTIQTGTTQHIQLKFNIDETGQVLKASVESMTDPDPDLQTCVLRALKHIKFPPTPDHKSKTLQYPLILKPEA